MHKIISIVIFFGLVPMNLLAVELQAIGNYDAGQNETPTEQDRKVQDETRLSDCQIIPKQEASRTAQVETGGKVIDIKLRLKGKKPTYRVRVLVDEKRVKNIVLDACR